MADDEGAERLPASGLPLEFFGGTWSEQNGLKGTKVKIVASNYEFRVGEERGKGEAGRFGRRRNKNESSA